MIHGIRKSLSAKLIVSLLLCLLIPMLIFGVIYTYRLRDALMQSERRGVSQSVEMGLAQVDSLVQEMMDVINALAISNQVKTMLASPSAIPSYEWFLEYKTFENLLATVAAKGTRTFNVTCVSALGKVYATSAQYNSMLTLKDPLIAAILENRNSARFLNRVLLRLDDNPFLTCGKAFYDKGALLGVVLVDAPLSGVSEIMQGMEKDGVEVYVLNREGEMLYANKDSSGIASEEALKAALLKNSPQMKVAGADYMVIPAQSDRTGLSMLAMVPMAAVFANSNQLFVQMMFIFVGIVLVAALVLVGLTKGVSKGLVSLNRAVSAFGETGDEIALAPKTLDEVGQLTEGAVAMSRRIVRLLKQIREDEHRKWLLEFNVLQSQINPHMIYNTLNTITYLAQLQNVKNIEDISSSFVLLLRMISNRNGEYISVREELACVTAYVAIKRYSTPWDIALNVKADEKTREMRILKLLLQPFVENAIVHGFSGRIGECRIDVTLKMAGEALHIHIRDNGAGMEPRRLDKILSGPVKNSAAFNNVGVYNTVRRLQLAYGEQATFEIQSEPGKGTDVSISFPAQIMED